MKTLSGLRSASDNDILVRELAYFQGRQVHVNANFLFSFHWLEECALYRVTGEVGGKPVVQKFKERLAMGFSLGFPLPVKLWFAPM